jgi:pheromone shutdown protein TraB
MSPERRSQKIYCQIHNLIIINNIYKLTNIVRNMKKKNKKILIFTAFLAIIITVIIVMFVFKINKTRAEANFQWFDLGFGLRIKD